MAGGGLGGEGDLDMPYVDKANFTHYASFYLVPCYAIFEEDSESGTFEMCGRNRLCDYMLSAATFFHNYTVEPVTQFIMALTGQEYAPGFPIMIKGEINETQEPTMK